MYDRLQKVGLVVSHSITLRWLKKLASTYDSEIVSWRNRLADNLDVFEEVIYILYLMDILLT